MGSGRTEARSRGDRDAARRPGLARELADLAAQLSSIKGEAAVEARRRVRLNEGRER